jgi:hypothetical protein
MTEELNEEKPQVEIVKKKHLKVELEGIPLSADLIAPCLTLLQNIGF